MTIEFINPPGVSASPVYTQLVTVQDVKLLFLAGQVAWDANGNIVGEGDFRAQAVQVYENIKTILASQNATMSDIVKTTTYIPNLSGEHRAILIEVVKQYFNQGQPPTSTLLGVQSLARPGLLIEIEAVAAIKA